MAERKKQNPKLIKIGKLLETKRKALGKQYRSREGFIDKRSEELFGFEDWISERYLFNVEHGKNWISIEKFLVLAKALEQDPIELFREIVTICNAEEL